MATFFAMRIRGRRRWHTLTPPAASSHAKVYDKVCIMTRTDLLARVRQKPFRPFRLVLSEGAVYEIRHPDLIMVGRDAMVIGQAQNPEQDFFDSTVLIDLFHVVRLEPLDTPTPSASNGSQG